jgi:hypothetical protein
MSLIELDIELDDELPLPAPIEQWLATARQRTQVYWDQFVKRPLPQYIECDFEWVARGLEYCRQRNLPVGNMFVEWGCGFGVITGAAGLLGFEAIGIEVEPFLCEEGRKLLAANSINAEIWQGNFLPGGARKLADDTDPLVSLSHLSASAYEQNQMGLDDFALVYAYPWPGEEHFLRCVFERYARSKALMLMYRGPYQIELYQKK